MPWFHVDDGFHSHPKVLATSLSARGLWATAGSWSSAHLTGGFLRDNELASLGGTPELAAELVTAGLWRRRRGGYQFHEWHENGNPTKQEVTRMREVKAAAGRMGGLASARTRSSRTRRETEANSPVENSGSSAGTSENRADQQGHRSKPQARASPPASPVVEPQAFSSYRAKDAGGRASPRGSPPASKTKPAWCGVCDRDTRLTGPADQPYRCPECHPVDGRRAR